MTVWLLSAFACLILSSPQVNAIRKGKSGQWIGSRQSGGQAQKCNPCIATLHLDPSSQSAMHWDPVAGAIDLASLAATPRYQLRHHAPGPSSGFDAMMAAQHAAPATGDERPDKQDSADAAQQAARQDAHASMQPSNQAGGDSFLIHVAYYDTYTSEGWDRLEIRVNERVPIPDVIKAHAVGYAEAYFTGEQIYKYWTNYRLNEFAAGGGSPSPALLRYVRRQHGFVRSNVGKKGHGSKYWRLMGLVMSQFDGLCEGFWANVGAASHNMTWEELYLLQSVGDLYDLNVLFPPHKHHPESDQQAGHSNLSDIEDSSYDEVPGPSPARRYTPGHGEVGPWGYDGAPLECSAAIKLRNGTGMDILRARAAAAAAQPREAEGSTNPDRRVPRSRSHFSHGTQRPRPQDTYFWAGHATWRPYYAMTRTWKAYDLPWSETGPMVVSSSPGLLFSKDDWYTTDRFVIMETTNGVYNKTLYDLIPEHCALMWQRVLVANLGATGGKEWVELFAKHNSGTYNNQWMVLDVDALESGWQHDVLWVLEQLPGMTEQADMSRVLLEQGYWVSYNVPYFPNVYNISGYPTNENLWESAPRAKIFAREIPSVQSTEGLQRLLRLNRYQDDPLSDGRPNNAIASRYDLIPTPGHRTNWTRRAFGAVDAKVVDTRGFATRTTHVICGPTSDDQVPFRWSTSGFPANISHSGTVDQFDFGWQTYTSLRPIDDATATTRSAAGNSALAGDRPPHT